MSPRSLFEGIAEDAVAPIGQVGGALLVKAALLLLALVGVGVGAAFLTSALFIVVVEWLGRIEALLVVGGLYLAVAITFATFVFSQDQVGAPAAKRSATPKSEAAGKADGAASVARTASLALATAGAGESTEARESGTGPALDRLATPMMELLHEQGMERERLALAAGLTVAKELRPWMLVGLMVALGVVMGHFARHQASSERPVGVPPQ
jgi:hypothetical protein